MSINFSLIDGLLEDKSHLILNWELLINNYELIKWESLESVLNNDFENRGLINRCNMMDSDFFSYIIKCNNYDDLFRRIMRKLNVNFSSSHILNFWNVEVENRLSDYNLELIKYLRVLKNNGKNIILVSSVSKCLDIIKHLIRLGILDIISDVYSFYEGNNSVSEFLRNSVRYVPDISKCLWLESSYIDMRLLSIHKGVDLYFIINELSCFSCTDFESSSTIINSFILK